MKNILDKHRKDPLKENVVKFLSSIEEDLWILKEDVVGTIAHVIMLHEQAIITDNEIKHILKELVNIIEKIDNGTFEIDKNFEDIHPYIENIVIQKVGTEIGGKIHSARSRNDQVALDIRLKVRSETLVLIDSLIKLMKSLLDNAEKAKEFNCPLYTHLQRGQLGVFSHYFLNYSYQIERMILKLFSLFDEINKNPLGACAIGGTSFPISRKKVTELLAFDAEIFNSLDAVSSRDHIISAIMVLTLIADMFSRICEDLIIWSSKEFGFVEFNDAYSSVSSAMPQKKNPDTAELIKGKMGRVYGALNHILFMSKGTPSGYVRDFQESKVALQTSFSTINMSVNILTGIFDTLIIHPEKMKSAVDNSLVLSLDLAEIIAKETNLSFREAHGLIGALVKKYDSNRDKIFNSANIEKISKEIFKKKATISQKDIDDILDLDYALSLRKSLGSPNKNQIELSIKSLKEKIQNYQIKVSNLMTFVQERMDELLQTAKKLSKILVK
ncbi:MAG: argininosuccinate lyase [Candidatus Lokiarchaeota archaeon]|nr:argininosuccinate lyase [Candidatus Lokiarchaeota archaeon]